MTKGFISAVWGGSGSYGVLPPQSQISVSAGDQSGVVTITAPQQSAYFGGTLLVCKAGSAMPADESDGTVLDAQKNAAATITGLQNGTQYTVRAFGYNPDGEYQTDIEGAVASFTPAAGTPLSSFAVGAKLRFGSYYNEPIVWTIVDKNHAGYPSGSVTLAAQELLCLKAFDGAEPQNTASSMQVNGNGRWLHSNLRQWLNSDAAAGGWYTAQHAADTPPSAAYTMEGKNPYDQEAGFLNAFTAQEKAALLETTLTCLKPQEVSSSGGTETTVDRIFLPSTTELATYAQNDTPEGTALAAFSDDASRICLVGQACYDNAADKGSFVAGQANDWWTRTIDWGYGNRAMRITYNGSSSNQYCNGFIGVRPFCNLSGNVKLSLTADSDGVYDIVAFV